MIKVKDLVEKLHNKDEYTYKFDVQFFPNGTLNYLKKEPNLENAYKKEKIPRKYKESKVKTFHIITEDETQTKYVLIETY